MTRTTKIQTGNPWETTAVKYSFVLKGFAEFMRKNPSNKTKPYDNRHLRMKVV